MKISLDWLSDYVTWEGTPEELAERLTLSGLNVEEIERFSVSFPGVVVAEVRECGKHPDADKLSLCTVFDGESELQVVCGAPNVRAGLTVLLARVGAVLPGDFKIKKSKIRGEESRGMICSASELRFSEESDGIMELDVDVPAGTPADELYGFEDVVFDIEVTPNRPDWLSHYGVAREVAALQGSLLDAPVVWSPPHSGGETPEISVEIDDFADCPRYTAHLARGVEMGESPRWMRNRLLAVGLRPINNVVDVTNYVMHELGQPLHAFDRDKLSGTRIYVRRAEAGATLTTLDDQPRTLTADELMIADASGDIALAGVMGGAKTEVDDGTKDVLLESAAFAPGLVRRTSRRLQLLSDASYRFERGADWNAVELAARRALHLFQEYAGARIDGGYADRQDPDRNEHEAVTLRVQQANRLLGTDLTAPAIVDYLQALGLKCQPLGQASDRDSREGRLMVKVPSFRRDIVQEVDLIEEVARMHGFETGEDGQFRALGTRFERPDERYVQVLRRHLTAVGYHEIVTSSFMARGDLEALGIGDDDVRSEMLAVADPHHGGETLLRTTLTPSLLAAVRHNLNADARTPFRLCQYGRSYLPGGRSPVTGRRDVEDLLPEEPHVFQFAVIGRDDTVYGDAPAALMELKGAVEDLNQRTRIPLELVPEDVEPYLVSGQQFALRTPEGETVGFCGMAAPAVLRRFEIDVPVAICEWNVAALDLAGETLRYEAFSRYPAAKRDLSLVVPAGVSYAQVESCVRDAGGPLLRSVELFDHFAGKGMAEGSASLGIRLKFQSPKGNLKGKAVEVAVTKIQTSLDENLDVTVRT